MLYYFLDYFAVRSNLHKCAEQKLIAERFERLDIIEATCTSAQSRNHIILRLSHISYNCDYCTFQL